MSLLLAIFILRSPALAEENIKIGGVGSALGSMRLLAAAFEKSHPGVKVTILPSLGSSGAFKAMVKGAIDIGLSGRPMKEEELKLGLLMSEYAKTPFVFITKRDVNIADISTEKIIKIYKGELETWPDGKRIRPVLRPAGDSDTLILAGISPEMGKAVETALSRHGMLIAITDQENADLIEKTPGAFGASTLAQIISEKRLLKILSYNGVTPSAGTLANGTYPLFKPFFIVTTRDVSAPVRQFIDFIRSPAGRKILEKSGSMATIGTQER